MSEVHIYLIRFGGQPHVLPHSSLSFFLLFSPTSSLRSLSQVTLRSGIFPWA